MLTIFTDGACRGNGTQSALGSWSFVVVCNDKVIYTDKAVKLGITNNIMELSGVIAALKYIKAGFTKDTPVLLHCDSLYVVNGATVWMNAWASRNWKRKGSDIPNASLWKELYSLHNQLNITFKWVRGHADSKYNNLADRLCNEALNEYV